MKRRLVLFRHAKSDRPDGVDDEHRPLAERGRRDGARMGQYMDEEHLLPDLALVSTALRARETWQAARSAFPRGVPEREQARIYGASPRTLLAVVRETAPDIGSLLLVGHNPGLHELALALIGKGKDQAKARLREGLPTAGLVVIDFAVEDWSAIADGLGTLERFETPGTLG